MNDWTMGDAPSQRGKLAIVTGATGGLGYEIALALAQAGAEVIVASKNRCTGARHGHGEAALGSVGEFDGRALLNALRNMDASSCWSRQAKFSIDASAPYTY